MAGNQGLTQDDRDYLRYYGINAYSTLGLGFLKLFVAFITLSILIASFKTLWHWWLIKVSWSIHFSGSWLDLVKEILSVYSGTGYGWLPDASTRLYFYFLELCYNNQIQGSDNLLLGTLELILAPLIALSVLITLLVALANRFRFIGRRKRGPANPRIVFINQLVKLILIPLISLITFRILILGFPDLVKTFELLSIKMFELLCVKLALIFGLAAVLVTVVKVIWFEWYYRQKVSYLRDLHNRE